MGGILYPTPLTFSEIGGSQVVRACMEAIATRRVEPAPGEEVAGQPAKNVALGGGMVRTRTWPRIVADVLNDELLVSPTRRSPPWERTCARPRPLVDSTPSKSVRKASARACAAWSRTR